ncbi:MAG: GlsB/YeaQ/YmgE family stress response membrane protein, partial [Acidimicrobiia bacterium]
KGAAMVGFVLAQDVGTGDFDLGTILVYILIGLVVGALARVIVPGTGGMSWVLTIVVGILGALIGGYLAGAVWEDTAGVDWIASIVVAALLVFIVSRMGGRSRGT